MRQTPLLLLRKLITIPSLSPSHTASRVLSRLVPSNTHVTEYQPILLLQCSPDLIADPANRKSILHQPRMLLESLEEGKIRWRDDLILEEETGGKDETWYKVGMVIGEIIEDDDDVVEEWTWQAYLDEQE